MTTTEPGTLPATACADGPCTRLCRLDEVPAGGAHRVALPGRPALAVFNLEGHIHVTDDTCTHGDASLCDGEIDDGVVECPYHQGAFDIATGQAVGAPCTVALRVYPVEVVDGVVSARLD